jgi:prevent-host-death family protein
MKGIGIADLKARLSEHLKAVRRGRTLTILDRNTPIARIVPITEGPLKVRKATRRPSELIPPSPPAKRTNSLAVLREDRARR